MALQSFISRRFSEGSMQIIEKANEIIQEYQGQGFQLTLRQLYYQFVSRDLIPNKQSEYKRLGSIINDGRLAGYIDWDAIVDRTRNLQSLSTWEHPADILDAVAEQYRQDIWDAQDYRPEVWIEKDALVGVIEDVCQQFRAPYFACRGYSSQSEQYAAGVRFAEYRDRGQTPIVLHLGDHDPSGIDMTRDNADRLSMFADSDVEVRRLALNFEQVQQYRPPPNPAKETDSRSTSYINRFGAKSWELDALEPRVIRRLIESEIEDLIDRDRWDEVLASEDAAKSKLDGYAKKLRKEVK